MNDVLRHSEHWECMTCGHEWPRAADRGAYASLRMPHGNVLADGDCVVLIKDLPLKGAKVLKGGTKTKPIRLGDGDHEISCKIDGMAVGLKACFVRKGLTGARHRWDRDRLAGKTKVRRLEARLRRKNFHRRPRISPPHTW